jgi:PAB-dependent poly(A)-specific ribonuclease subunit 3
LPTIQPAPPDKGAPHLAPSPSPSASLRPKGYTHASATASSSSSTTDAISELTSSSSRDSLPAAHARGGASTATTPQKQTRSYRRTKSTKAAAKWSDAAPQPKNPPTAAHTSPTGTHLPAQARFMATAFGGPSGDSRRGVSSPRPKGREAKNTFCRNVTIYGHCRYENSKCRPPRLLSPEVTLSSLPVHPRPRQAEPERER